MTDTRFNREENCVLKRFSQWELEDFVYSHFAWNYLLMNMVIWTETRSLKALNFNDEIFQLSSSWLILKNILFIGLDWNGSIIFIMSAIIWIQSRCRLPRRPQLIGSNLCKYSTSQKIFKVICSNDFSRWNVRCLSLVNCNIQSKWPI